MGLRRNLCPNPACAVDATGWSAPGGGYGRGYSSDPAFAPVTWAGNGASGNADGRSVPDDDALQAGDHRLIVFSISTQTIDDVPAGVVELNPGGSIIASTRRIYWFLKVHEGDDEPATLDFGFTAAANHSMAQFAVRAADPTTPIDVSVAVGSATSGDVLTAPSRDVATPGALYLTSFHKMSLSSGTTLPTPAGMTTVANGAGSGTAGHAFRVAAEVRAAAASTGTRTSTSDDSGNPWGASSLVIRPAPRPGMPRATVYAGSTAGDVNTPRALVSAGQAYVFALAVRAVAVQNLAASVNWYNAPSGGSYISNTGAVGQPEIDADDIERIVIGPYTAPAGAQSAQLKLQGVDAGGIEVTAVRVCGSSGDLVDDSAYFDGATPGAGWDGTVGASTSTMRLLTETIGWAETFSTVETVDGPVGADVWPVTETFTVLASGSVPDEWGFADSFLIASLTFDEARGRARIEAFTFPAPVASMRVSAGPPGGGYQLVRGGLVPVIDGWPTRPVDHYEYEPGVVSEYLIEGIDEAGVVRALARVRRDGAADRPWLKVIADPASNQRIVLIDEPVEVGRDERSSLYRVQGRATPVVVSDVHSARAYTVRLVTEGAAARDRLDEALRRGQPVYLQVPPDGPVPTMYASVGAYRWRRSTRTSNRWIFTVPLTEVDPPAATIAGSTTTYATVAARYPSYDALLAANPTYRHLADS